MSVDPVIMTPKPGAGLPLYGGIVANILRPAPFSCLAGTVPSIPAYTPPAYNVIRIGEHAVIAPGVLPGSVIFIGDSITEQLDVAQITPFAANFGISSDTTAGVLNRLSGLAGPLSNARAAHLLIGINNINGGIAAATTQSQLMSIFNWLTGPLVWTKILPTQTLSTNTAVNSINSYITAQLAGRPNFVAVDMAPQLVDGSGLLKSAFAIDNVHLNSAGNALWMAALRTALATL